MADRRGPRRRVGLRIVDGDGDVERAVVRAAEALGDLPGVGQRAAVGVQPHAVAEAARLHDQRVAVPLAHRIAVPRRHRIRRQRPAVREDLPVPDLAFAQDDDQAGRLHDFPVQRRGVHPHDADRQALRVGIVQPKFGRPLLREGGGPRLIRQPAGDSPAHVHELLTDLHVGAAFRPDTDGCRAESRCRTDPACRPRTSAPARRAGASRRPSSARPAWDVSAIARRAAGRPPTRARRQQGCGGETHAVILAPRPSSGSGVVQAFSPAVPAGLKARATTTVAPPAAAAARTRVRTLRSGRTPVSEQPTDRQSACDGCHTSGRWWGAAP